MLPKTVFPILTKLAMASASPAERSLRGMSGRGVLEGGGGTLGVSMSGMGMGRVSLGILSPVGRGRSSMDRRERLGFGRVKESFGRGKMSRDGGLGRPVGGARGRLSMMGSLGRPDARFGMERGTAGNAG